MIPIQSFHDAEFVQPVFIPSFTGGIFCGFPSACEAMRKGTDKDWEQRAGCMTFPDAVSKVEPEGRVGWVKFTSPEKSFRMLRMFFPFLKGTIFKRESI